MIELRDYQYEALAAWIRHKRKGVIELPTGSGKTWIGLKAIQIYLRAGYRCMVIVPTEVLLNQWVERLVSRLGLPRWRVGLLYAKEKSFRDVAVAIINTAIKFKERIAREYKLLVLDEVHHYYAERWIELIKACYNTCDILGLSATATRADNRHVLVRLPIVYRLSYNHLQARGYVAPYRVYVIRVPLTPVERRKYEELDDAIRKIAQDLEWADKEEEKELKLRLMKLVNLRRQLCSEAVNKLPAVLEVVRRHSNERIIVFTESIRTCYNLRRYLEAHGIRCGVVHSKVRHRESILRAWSRGVFNVLLTVRVLDEGIDVPEASVGVIVSNSLTRRQAVQRIGRVVRPGPNKIAKIYVIIAQGTFEERIPWVIRRAIM